MYLKTTQYIKDCGFIDIHSNMGVTITIREDKDDKKQASIALDINEVETLIATLQAAITV